MSKKKREPCFLIEVNAQAGDKIKISPIGEFKGVDGRPYVLNAGEVVAKTSDRKIDIVLNVNHGWDNENDKSAGWFDHNSLEVREDGIYANLDTTDIGEGLISKKHYKYLSPEYRVARSDNGNLIVLEIVGVGLVNRPNLLDEALNEQEQTEQEEETLPTEKEIELQKQLEEQKETNRQLALDAKKTKIETAIAAGELMPNKQAFAMGLDGEQLESFLALNKEDAKHLATQTKPDESKEEPELSEAEIEVNKQLGLGA